MTTPDPAALREALERMNERPRIVRGNERLLTDLAPVVRAARWALDLIERGKEDKAAHLLYWGWTVIANAGGGDWTREAPEWKEAAIRWRDEWHELLQQGAI